MRADRDEPLSNSTRLSGVLRRMHLLIGFLGLTTVGMIAYGFHKGHKMAATHAPLVDAVMEINAGETAQTVLLRGARAGVLRLVRPPARAILYSSREA